MHNFDGISHPGSEPVQRLGKRLGRYLAILRRHRDLIRGHLQVDIALPHIEFHHSHFVVIFRLPLTHSCIGLLNVCSHSAALKNRDADRARPLKNGDTLVWIYSLQSVIAADAQGWKIFRLRSFAGFLRCLQLHPRSFQIRTVFHGQFHRLFHGHSRWHFGGQFFR